jgi:hypothetical protein
MVPIDELPSGDGSELITPLTPQYSTPDPDDPSSLLLLFFLRMGLIWEADGEQEDEEGEDKVVLVPVEGPGKTGSSLHQLSLSSE